MNKIIRIGTRESALAMWQANTFQDLLNSKGFSSELIPIKSEGDLDLVQPLYEMGTVGIFTKTLDTALLNNRIDLAIHSMKDVPTLLPKGIQQAAVLERGPVKDVLVNKTNAPSLEIPQIIATGSLRRKAQWLSKFPNHNIVPLRGNIQTRLTKLKNEDWDGAIFAEAALVRLKTENESVKILDWMIPAPAQGALMIVCKSRDKALLNVLDQFNHPETALCTRIERDFLRTLEGGCTAPIGALATEEGNNIQFQGGVFSLDGKRKFIIDKTFEKSADQKGIKLANQLLKAGASDLLQEFKSSS
ncbi:MAG: hydroxymethylbilane synthase [Flavobacteriaceae bacterium]|nr:hydroxymethylbilane synthase [Flavobacteriaceae bacterium]